MYDFGEGKLRTSLIKRHVGHAGFSEMKLSFCEKHSQFITIYDLSSVFFLIDSFALFRCCHRGKVNFILVPDSIQLWAFLYILLFYVYTYV